MPCESLGLSICEEFVFKKRLTKAELEPEPFACNYRLTYTTGHTGMILVQFSDKLALKLTWDDYSVPPVSP